MSNTRLTWSDIKKKYPDQWIGLVDIEYEPDNDATIKSAIVKYDNKTKGELTLLQVQTKGKVIARYTTPDNSSFLLGR